MFQMIIGVFLLCVTLAIIWLTGGFSSTAAFLDFIEDLSISLIATILPSLVGAALLIWGGQGLCRTSEGENRNKGAIRKIEERVTDLGYSKEQWKIAKKANQNDGD